MAIEQTSPSVLAARKNMGISIAKAAKEGRLSISDELHGYRLAAMNTAESYNVTPVSLQSQSSILAPEILTGLVANKYT